MFPEEADIDIFTQFTRLWFMYVHLINPFKQERDEANNTLLSGCKLPQHQRFRTWGKETDA